MLIGGTRGTTTPWTGWTGCLSLLLAGLWASTAIGWRSDASPVPLAEPPDSCTVLTAGTTEIKAPGSYCLAADLSSPAGIRIVADDVQVDLAGHCLYGSGKPADVQAGFRISGPRRRIAIANGCVSGFMYGILVEDPADRSKQAEHITITSMRLFRNWFRGAMVAADHASITSNDVSEIGGTMVYEDAYAIGIEVRGNHCRITGNQVSEVYPTGSGEGVGISVTDPVPDCVVADNAVRNSRIPEWGRTFGIWSLGRTAIHGNVMANHTISLAVGNEEVVWGNVAIGEACRAYSQPLADRVNTVVVPSPGQQECPQDLDVALKRVVKGHRDSLLGVAMVYHTNGDFTNAVVYYHGAAELGSAEARRQIDRFLQLGLVTPDQVDAAARRARELDLW